MDEKVGRLELAAQELNTRLPACASQVNVHCRVHDPYIQRVGGMPGQLATITQHLNNPELRGPIKEQTTAISGQEAECAAAGEGGERMRKATATQMED